MVKHASMAFLLALFLANCIFMISCNNELNQVEEATSKIAFTTVVEDTEPVPPEVKYETVMNPLCEGADPWVIRHDNKYYSCWGDGNGVIVRQSRSLSNIDTGISKKVYTAPTGTIYSSEYWAPELHYLQGEWYIYVAADDGNNANHRMYVLKGTTQNPTDPFEMVGQITDPTNKWAIDGTIVTIKNELYFVWSGLEGGENVSQNLYIAHMSNPWTIDSERVLIASPEYDWEKVGGSINEGPEALYHGDDIFLVYSASGGWTIDYCLGLLTFVGEDPLDPSSWVKEKEPVFSKLSSVAYGPGHNSFTTAIDGSIWMVYHAKLVPNSSDFSGRWVWISPVNFDAEGKPIFGEPSKEVRFPIKLVEAK